MFKIDIFVLSLFLRTFCKSLALVYSIHISWHMTVKFSLIDTPFPSNLTLAFLVSYFYQVEQILKMCKIAVLCFCEHLVKVWSLSTLFI
jgi:hypothetical protein